MVDFLRIRYAATVISCVLLLALAACAQKRPAAAQPDRRAGEGAVPSPVGPVPPEGMVIVGESSAEPMPEVRELDVAKANQPRPVEFQRDDMIKLMVWGYPELTHIATVQEDGTVTFPIVGEVAAVGRTARELREEIAQRFREFLSDEPVRIQREDILAMTVWGHEDLTHIAEVQMDGMITLPLIGPVHAAGKTINELRNAITIRMGRYVQDPQVSILPERLSKRTIANPQVSILPEQLRSRQVAVVGEVNIPGLYPIRGKLRVMEALALSHYKDSAELNSVVIIRDYDGRPEYTVLKLKDFINRRAPDQNIYLQAGDIVIVPKTMIAKISDFIANFFTGTRGIFDWWIALQQARYADEFGKATERLNDTLFLLGQ